MRQDWLYLKEPEICIYSCKRRFNFEALMMANKVVYGDNYIVVETEGEINHLLARPFPVQLSGASTAWSFNQIAYFSSQS